jgi:hypothetical protein
VPIQVARSKIERRLQKLEAVLTDASRAVPHTRRWLLYWTEIIAKYMIGELTRETLPGLIPLEAHNMLAFWAGSVMVTNGGRRRLLRRGQTHGAYNGSTR